MIIEPGNKRPPRIFYGFIWRCEVCGRSMICEKGVNRWNEYFLERIRVCPECDVRYADSPFKSEEDKS